MKDVGAMGIDRAYADVEIGGDFFGSFALCDPAQDFYFPAGQLGLFKAGIEVSAGYRYAEKLFGHSGAEVNIASGYCPDRRDQFLGVRLLEEVAPATDFQAASQVMRIAVHGQEDNGQVRIYFEGFFGGLQAAHARHFNIQQQDIGLGMLEQSKDFCAIVGFSGDFEVGFAAEQGLSA